MLWVRAMSSVVETGWDLIEWQLGSRLGVCLLRLVPNLLYRLVGLLPLSTAKEGSKVAAKLPPGEAAAAAAVERAQGKAPALWKFPEVLRAADDLGEEALAPAIFRATLRALPASARAWFQSIRDKKLSAAVSVSCRIQSLAVASFQNVYIPSMRRGGRGEKSAFGGCRRTRPARRADG